MREWLLGSFIAALTLVAATASAQTQITTWTPVQEGPAITAALGGAFNNHVSMDSFGSILDRAGSSLEISARVDAPVHDRFLVRLEAGKATWRFTGDEYAKQPTFADWRNPPDSHVVSDRIAIKRVTVSVVRRHLRSASGWAPLYAGGGAGAYYFRSLERGRQYSQPWQLGIHGLVGLEVPVPDTRFVFVTEAQIHFPGVPWDSVINRTWFNMLSLSLAMKVRM